MQLLHRLLHAGSTPAPAAPLAAPPAAADADHQGEGGATALHNACRNSNVEVAKLLLERGANQKLQIPGFGDAKVVTQRMAVRKEELLALLARY